MRIQQGSVCDRSVCVQLQESWWREVQVLPMRTHPTMTTSGTGGYLLTGTRVLNAQRPEQQERSGTAEGRARKKRRTRV